MDYSQEKNGGGQDTTSQLCSLGLHYPAAHPRLGVPWEMTEWLFGHTTLVAAGPLGGRGS